MKKIHKQVILLSVSLLFACFFFGNQYSDSTANFTPVIEQDRHTLWTSPTNDTIIGESTNNESELISVELLNSTITFQTNTSAEDSSKILWGYSEWRNYIILQNYNSTESELDDSMLANETFQTNLHISTIMAWGQYNGSLSEEELSNLFNQMEHQSVTFVHAGYYESSDERLKLAAKIKVKSNGWLLQYYEARTLDIYFWSSDSNGKWHYYFPFTNIRWYTKMAHHSLWWTDSNVYDSSSTTRTVTSDIITGSKENNLYVWFKVNCIYNGIGYTVEEIYYTHLVDDDTEGPNLKTTYYGGYTDANPGFVSASGTDASGGSFTTPSFYFVPSILGSHSFTFAAVDYDNDRPGDESTSSKTVTIPIHDDDISGPVITINHVGTGTDTDPGFWSVSVNDPESGVFQIIVKVDGYQVGTTGGNYIVPNTLGFHSIYVYALNNDNDRWFGIDREATEKTHVKEIVITPPSNPLVDVGLDQSIDEGSTATFSGSFTDPGIEWEIYTYQWNFGDGTVINDAGTLSPTHKYVEDGLYVVTLTVYDNYNGIGSDTLFVNVNNVAPSVDAGSDQTVDEGDIVSFEGSFEDPGEDDTHIYQWDFGDGTVIDDAGTLIPTHIYNDNGIYTVNLAVFDDDGVGSDTLVVTVNNIAPSVEAGSDQTVNEGVLVFFEGSFEDPGEDDTHIYQWDFGDGTINDDAGMLTPTHTYNDNGIYTVTLTVFDDDDGIGTDTLTITVNNVAPIVDAGSDQIVDEGALVSFGGSFEDSGEDDTHIYQWDFGDGTIIEDDGSLIPTHIYSDDEQYTVTLTVTDDDGGVGIAMITVTVNNVAPIVDVGSDQIVDEGDKVYFVGSFEDPGEVDTHIYQWDFGDGTIINNAGTLTPSHRYFDNGTYTVRLWIWDDDFGFGFDTLIVTVNNVAPTVDVGFDQTSDEGTEVFFDGSFTDPGWLDTHTFVWDFGDGSPTVIGTLIPSHTYADNGAYTVTLTVTDDDDASSSDTLTVTVDNVAPTVDVGLDQTVDEGDTISFVGVFDDPGWLDTHTVLWNFGDGSPTETGTLSPSHEYGDNGTYFVTLTVTDNDGGLSSDTLTVMVDNVAPTVDAGPDITVDEDEHFTLYGSFTDPGWLDTHTIFWFFWSDLTGFYGILDPTYTYHFPGEYIVTLVVIDDDEGFGSDTVTITVLDKTAPTTTLTFLGEHHISDQIYISSTATKIQLEAIDAEMPHGSDVAIIQYQIDSTTGTWLTYEDPFTIDIIGTHTIFYRSIDNAGNVETANSVEVVVNASELTYLESFAGTYSDPVNLEAYLMDIATGLPIPGKTIEFTLGTQSFTAVTDSYGIAHAILILDQPEGICSVSAFFTEDEEYLGSNSEASEFTINKEFAYAKYTGDMVVPLNAETITLRATVFDQDDGYWGDLSKIYITITILDSGTLVPLYISEPLEVEITSVDGVGVAIITIPNELPEEGYLILISFDPDENDYYEGDDSEWVTLIIYEPIGDFVTGGGWIIDENGNKGNFGFNVKYKKNGLPKGQAIYVYREGDYIYIIKSNAWVGMAIISDQNYTIFEAKCNVMQINALTCEIVWEEGNYRLVIEAWDHSKDGKEDIFHLRVYDKIGLIYYETGFDPYGFLGGGNIVIHIDEKK